MALERGQETHDDGTEIGLPSSGSGNKGDAVHINASGQVAPTTAGTENVIGVLAEDAPAADEPVLVRTGRLLKAYVGGGVSAGDVLEPDSSMAGRLVPNGPGLVQDVDEGGSDTYTLSTRGMVAVRGAGGSFRGEDYGPNEAPVLFL